MEHFDDGENARRIPLFQAAGILIVVIALLALVADRYMSSDPEAADAGVELAGQGSATAAGAQPVPPQTELATQLLQHWEELQPVITALQNAWETRDVDALRESHDQLVRSMESVPIVPPNASETDRTYRAAYHEALLFLEDGVDDLREGLEIPNPLEWEEGMLDVRTGRVRLDAVIQRIRSGR